MAILPLKHDWQKVLGEILIRLGIISDDYTGSIIISIIKGRIAIGEKKEEIREDNGFTKR